MSVLEIEETRRKYGEVYFKITKQDTRILKRAYFNKRMSNGAIISSVNAPEARESESTFFIRGDMKRRDSDECCCDEYFFEQIVEAIKELNGIYTYEEVY